MSGSLRKTHNLSRHIKLTYPCCLPVRRRTQNFFHAPPTLFKKRITLALPGRGTIVIEAAYSLCFVRETQGGMEWGVLKYQKKDMMMNYYLFIYRVERYAAIGDTLDILCPFFDEGSDELTEQSIIYRVSEEEYENCERRSNAKELGRCTQPYQQEKLKVAFRLMSPNPSGLDYRPGTTYYFISTSTGSRKGLYNEQGGLCASHNLKMVIHITDRNGDIGMHHHRHHHKKTTTTTTTTTTTEAPENSAEKLWEHFYEKVLPIENNWPEITRGERVTLYQGDKKDEYEQVPAEVVDFEIHEIGDGEFWNQERANDNFRISVESLYSPSGRLQYLLLLPAVIFLRLLWYVFLYFPLRSFSSRVTSSIPSSQCPVTGSQCPPRFLFYYSTSSCSNVSLYCSLHPFPFLSFLLNFWPVISTELKFSCLLWFLRLLHLLHS